MIEKRIVNYTYKNESEKVVNWYHHFIIEQKESFLFLDIIEEGENFLPDRKDMKHFSMPIEILPEIIEKILKSFFAKDMCKTSYSIQKNGNEYHIGSSFDFDRTGDFKEFHLTQEPNGDYMQGQYLSLRWNNVKISWHDNPRILPESLAWLIDNLKKVYNEWQKNHPEHPPISD